MNIATLAFAHSKKTLGLVIVINALRERFSDTEILPIDTRLLEDQCAAKQADYLLVSLYWWRDVYEFVRYLANAGIDPRQRKPTIIIGGMSALNPRVLHGYYHHAVMGDGEAVIGDLIEDLENGGRGEGIDGVWNPCGCKMAYQPELSADLHVDLRTNQTVRIEIARGCKQRCPFCQLTHIKPYRELPYAVVKHLIHIAPTKTISLFAPDTWSHSDAKRIESYCHRAGKNNSGSDVRLDMVHKVDVAARLRFGVEGFSERTRLKIGKIATNKKLLERLTYISTAVRTPKGPPISSATCYMIGDLPGETMDDVSEFWDVLSSWDAVLGRKFTLFLSTSAFMPSPFTPMWRARVEPYCEFNRWMADTRPRFEHLVIAVRGAVMAAPQRLCQMLTVRGDERARRAVFWLATKGHQYTRSTVGAEGKVVEAVVAKSGFPPQDLYRELPEDYTPPWSPIAARDERWKRGVWDGCIE